jgi:hypothetical protein
MSKKNKIKAKGKTNQPAVKIGNLKPTRDRFFSLWIVGILTITGLCLLPLLNNGFTNWDDELYVTQNTLLRGPDWLEFSVNLLFQIIIPLQLQLWLQIIR